MREIAASPTTRGHKFGLGSVNNNNLEKSGVTIPVDPGGLGRKVRRGGGASPINVLDFSSQKVTCSQSGTRLTRDSGVEKLQRKGEKNHHYLAPRGETAEGGGKKGSKR